MLGNSIGKKVKINYTSYCIKREMEGEDAEGVLTIMP